MPKFGTELVDKRYFNRDKASLLSGSFSDIWRNAPSSIRQTDTQTTEGDYVRIATPNAAGLPVDFQIGQTAVNNIGASGSLVWRGRFTNLRGAVKELLIGRQDQSSNTGWAITTDNAAGGPPNRTTQFELAYFGVAFNTINVNFPLDNVWVTLVFTWSANGTFRVQTSLGDDESTTTSSFTPVTSGEELICGNVRRNLSGGSQYDCALCIPYDRILSQAEIDAYLADPYQVFNTLPESIERNGLLFPSSTIATIPTLTALTDTSGSYIGYIRFTVRKTETGLIDILSSSGVSGFISITDAGVVQLRPIGGSTLTIGTLSRWNIGDYADILFSFDRLLDFQASSWIITANVNGGAEETIGTRSELGFNTAFDQIGSATSSGFVLQELSYQGNNRDGAGTGLEGPLRIYNGDQYPETLVLPDIVSLQDANLSSFTGLSSGYSEKGFALALAADNIVYPLVGAWTGSFTLADESIVPDSGTGNKILDGTIPIDVVTFTATDTVATYSWDHTSKDLVKILERNEANHATPTISDNGWRPFIPVETSVAANNVGTGEDYSTFSAWLLAVRNNSSPITSKVYIGQDNTTSGTQFLNTLVLQNFWLETLNDSFDGTKSTFYHLGAAASNLTLSLRDGLSSLIIDGLRIQRANVEDQGVAVDSATSMTRSLVDGLSIRPIWWSNATPIVMKECVAVNYTDTINEPATNISTRYPSNAFLDTVGINCNDNIVGDFAFDDGGGVGGVATNSLGVDNTSGSFDANLNREFTFADDINAETFLSDLATAFFDIAGGDYRIQQSYANTNLVGNGWENSDPASWLYLAAVGTTITINGISQTQSIEDVSVTQTGFIASVNDITQIQTIEEVTVVQQGVVTVDSTSQIQTIDEVTATQANFVLTINDLAQLQTIGVIDLTQASIITVNNATQVQTIDEISTVQQGTVNVENASQLQTIDEIIVTQAHVLTINPVSQAQIVEQVGLNIIGVVNINDASQVQTLDTVIVNTIDKATVILNSVNQGQTLDEIALTQANIVQVDSLSQQQLIDTILLGGVVIGYYEGDPTIFTVYNGDVLVIPAYAGSPTVH